MSRKVYRIHPDYNYSYFIVDNSLSDSFDSRLLSIGQACATWSEDWHKSELILEDSELKRGDICNFPLYLLIVTTKVVDLLGDFFDEILPATYEDEQLWIINTNRCFDCIDHNYREGVLRIKRFGLDCTKLPESGIFKISERASQLHVVTNDEQPELNFINKLQDNNLAGIRFELIWECN